MSGWQLAQRGRLMRSTDARLMALAVALIAAALAAVFGLNQRVAEAVRIGAAELIGADLVLSSRRALPEALRVEASRRGLAYAELKRFPSMAESASHLLLVDVKAATAGYPLRGRVIAVQADGQPPATLLPAPGTVWASERALTQLDAQLGDRIRLGEIELELTARVLREPDRAGGFSALAPSLLMAWDDLPRSGLIGPGARLNQQLLIAGPAAEIDAFAAFAEPLVDGLGTLATLEENQLAVGEALKRARQFLALAILSALILGLVALALAGHGFIEREQRRVALLRTFGCPRRQIASDYLLALGLALGASAALGAMLGKAIEEALIAGVIAAQELGQIAIGWSPAVFGFASAMLLIALVLSPALWQLIHTAPRLVLSDAQPPSRIAARLGLALGLLLLAGFISGDPQIAVSGSAALGLGCALLAAMVLALNRSLPDFRRLSPWRGLGELRRNPWSAMRQSLALGLGIGALAMLGVLSNDLIAGWQRQTPADAPNRFVLNVRADERPALIQALESAGATRLTHAPLAPGRLLAINGTDPRVIAGDDPLLKARIQRNQNLSWAAAMPDSNRLLAGRWPDPRATDEVAVEIDYARGLGLKLGDQLRFGVGEQRVEVRVVGLREVKWDSFSVNFFFVLSPAAGAALPHSEILSFHANDAVKQQLRALSRSYPAVSIVAVDELLVEVQRIIERVSQALRLIFGFSVVAGLLVFAVQLRLSLGQRLREAALLRALGAGPRALRAAIFVELAAQGLIAGLAGGLIAQFAGWVMATLVFEFALTPSLPSVLAWGAVGLALAAPLSYLLALRLSAVPVRTLLTERRR